MTPTESSRSHGPFDPDELVRWAETYGHPEEWAKRAQSLHAENERLRSALVHPEDAPQYRDGEMDRSVAIARETLADGP